MRATARGVLVLVLAVLALAVGLAAVAAAATGSEFQSDGAVIVAPSPAVQGCANAIMADLEVAAESDRWADVPAPRWEWLEDACTDGLSVSDGVAGYIQVWWEDMSYVIQGYGDTWQGCAARGWGCDL